MAKVETLSNVIIKTVDSFHDHRGQLFTLWEKSDFDFLNFNHDKVAISYKNVLRGLHTDKSWKLITCIHGSIQLVVANIDKNSPDYLNHIDIIINSDEKNKTFVLVPPGFINGHLVLSDEAVFYYKWCYEGEYPDINDQFSVNWADTKLGINWLSSNPILSDRDKKTPLL